MRRTTPPPRRLPTTNLVHARNLSYAGSYPLCPDGTTSYSSLRRPCSRTRLPVVTHARLVCCAPIVKPETLFLRGADEPSCALDAVAVRHDRIGLSFLHSPILCMHCSSIGTRSCRILTRMDLRVKKQPAMPYVPIHVYMCLLNIAIVVIYVSINPQDSTKKQNPPPNPSPFKPPHPAQYSSPSSANFKPT